MPSLVRRSVPEAAEALVGATLAQYVLKRLIGVGGMGAVYESTSPEGQPVAVKVLSPDYQHDAEIKRRFIEEGRRCCRLVHPNIVRVFEAGEAPDGTPYIVMELLDGIPLGGYVRSGARIPMRQAATMIQGVLAGLGAAHAQGIVHRNLKPENIVLAREEGGAFTSKILDFGIAKVMDAAGGMGSKTRTGALLGTPAYMSPEQIKNTTEVDARADLWSAAVLLYEMLTGRVAFPAPTEYARLSAVLNTNPQPLESIDPELSRLSAFMQLALQKDRVNRYHSALEMARALGAALGTEPMAPAVLPFTELPNVPSVWMPKVPLAPTPAPPPPAPTMASPPPKAQADSGKHQGSSTLASVMSHVRPDSIPPPTGAAQGTLPSENLPMLAAPVAPVVQGVAVSVVVVLVVSALLVGFLLGVAMMRLG